MSSINFSNLSSNNDYSSLFASMNANSSNNNVGSGNLLSDWASIKNGSYGKLTKAYYRKNAADAIDSDDAKKTVKSNNILKADADNLKAAVSEISGSSALFEKVLTKDADGNEVEDYDRDKIVKALKKFVDGYNSVIKAGAESDNVTVLRNTMNMTSATSANEKMLSSIGITIGEGNKLSLDEEKVKSANVGSIKVMFSGNSSYADSIGVKASNILNAINVENNKLSNYTAKGAYSSAGATGKIYDGTY